MFLHPVQRAGIVRRISVLAYLATTILFIHANLGVNAYGNESRVMLTDNERQWMAGKKKIIIAYDPDYPPYSFKNEQGKYVGIAVDITNKLAEKIGLKLEVYAGENWKSLYAAAQSGNVDVIATLVRYPGRENWFEFTRPYISLSQYVIARKDNIKRKSPPELLSGKTVALVEGYSTSDILLQEIPDIKPYYVDSLADALEAVSIGTADYTVADIGMANHLMNKRGLTNLGFVSAYTRELARQRYGVRKDLPELAMILDKALETLSYQELMQIYTRWRVPEILKPEAGFLSVMDELTLEQKQWLREHPVIRLASDATWPPFESIDKKGHYSGIAADYMALVEKRLGIKFMHSPREPWEYIVDKLKNKQLDVFSCAMETAARKEFAIFTEPYISHPMVIVSKNDIGFVNGLKGLHGKTIALEKDYATYDILSNQHPELKLQAHADSVSALWSVSRGNAYAYVGNIASISHILRKQGLTDLKVAGHMPYQFALSMGVRDDWAVFVPILQKALDSISLEEKNSIYKKWVGIEVNEPFDMRLLWISAGAVMFILALFIYWNHSLNSQIEIRTKELYIKANYDDLTNLPNRSMSTQILSDLIAEARHSGKNVAVLLLDIDDFKKINNVLGHNQGDQLLLDIARRLRKVLHGNSIMGRLGGDEFIVCLGGLDTPEDALSSIEKILNSFNQAFKLNGRELKLTVSIGVSSSPDDGDSISELLRSADTAMYHAKNLGRNTYSFFDAYMKEAVARRLLLEECMHGALERGEFEIYYQPKIGIESGKITGFEALLRWNNSELGQISPGEFICIAENNGLISAIGRHVFEQAVQQLLNWQSEYDQELTMAINLSPAQFRDEGFVDYITSTAAEMGLAKGYLELEITEGVLMSGSGNIIDQLDDLKQSGILITMDDFGTGYSSLSYLRNYPFDILKIDREFIGNIAADNADSKLAKATIAMASSLGLRVVAEGVETKEQLDILSGYGCDFAQGYLVSKPLPASDISNLLSAPVSTDV